ncbi:AfsR/SARP family transcriptional regulator [Actinocrinis sp.]|uniref:AfsR/SARP family transcriptional regulator n=1 Tax=Actinocrinis sp. TaxID=1920516 RepID=UPI002D3ACFC4|nr:BTAD domain-containing putative transcriptional regulator [Actinocrinis sp.]HZP53496.1 BTAD domain-containing putative transcriptional regulator [Actinocrinis sp.]
MEFGILGPLLVRDDSGSRFVHAGKQRILLAALLLRPEQTVPLETLADAIWDGQPPVSYVATMRNYVMRLRRSLGAAGYRVKTSLGGYRIALEREEFDVLRFAGLRTEGAAAYRAGAYERAVGLLGDALAVWRGPVLADVPSELLRGQEAPRLDRMRSEAEAMKAAAERMLGGAKDGGSGAGAEYGTGAGLPAGPGRGRTLVQEQGLELSVPTRQIHLRSLTYAGPHGLSRPRPLEVPLEAMPRPA